MSLALAAANDLAPLESLADALLCEHRILQRALPLMLERVIGDDALRADVLERLVESECRRIIESRLAFRHQQHKRETGGGPLGQQRANNLAGHAAAVAASLLDDFQLPNGRKLGDATRADLDAAMSAYRTNAADAEIKHRWLRLIQQSVPPGKTVREVLNDQRVAELREEARKG